MDGNLYGPPLSTCLVQSFTPIHTPHVLGFQSKDVALDSHFGEISLSPSAPFGDIATPFDLSLTHNTKGHVGKKKIELLQDKNKTNLLLQSADKLKHAYAKTKSDRTTHENVGLKFHFQTTQ